MRALRRNRTWTRSLSGVSRQAGKAALAAATAAATSAGPERATWPMTSAWRGLWIGSDSPEAAGTWAPAIQLGQAA
jgi:hypothetical protein